MVVITDWRGIRCIPSNVGNAVENVNVEESVRRKRKVFKFILAFFFVSQFVGMCRFE
jgi:hypothetical protein